jgi:hypothetical protein
LLKSDLREANGGLKILIFEHKFHFAKTSNLHQKQVSLNHLHCRIGRILFKNLLDIDARSIVIILHSIVFENKL